MGNEAGGAGTTNIPIAQPIILTAPTSLPDAPPDRVEKARQEARDEIHNQVIEQFPATRQMLVNPQRLAQLRATLISKYQLSQAQATQVLRDYVNNPSNMITNRGDADVQAAMNGGAAAQPPTPPEGSPQGTGAQTRDGMAAGSRGEELARMARSGGTATPPPTPGMPTPTPRDPTPRAPTPQVVVTAAPLPPPPGPGGMRGTGTGTGTGSTLVATGTGTTDGTTGNPESPTPQLPGEGSLLAPTVGTPGETGSVARPREFVMLCTTAGGRGTDPSPETLKEHHDAGANFRAKYGASGDTTIVGQMVVPNQPLPPGTFTIGGLFRERFASLSSTSSDSSSGGEDRGAEGVSRGSGGMQLAFRRGQNKDRLGGGGTGFV